MSIENVLRFIILPYIPRPSVEFAERDQVDSVLFYVSEEPLQFGPLRNRFPRGDAEVNIVVDYRFIFCPLVERGKLGVNG